MTRIAPCVLAVLLCWMLHPVEQEAQRIAELMQLRESMQIADVGAGDGYFGEQLAHHVGGSGRVYLQEIDDGELRKIRKRVERSELQNLVVVEGASDETGLPEGSCDALLLRFVYHHMSRPETMLASLHHSLRPTARIVMIEKGDNGGHGIRSEELIEQWSAAGFSELSRHLDWGGHDDQYAVVFSAGR